MIKLKWPIPNPFRRHGLTKARLAFEFGIVLSDAAKDLNIPMTKNIVDRAEKLLENELGPKSAKHFACNMNVYVLAILEPKD